MDGVKRLLASRLFWVLFGILGFASLLNVARDGLARDPRFIARPDFGGASLPSWGDAALLEPVMQRLEALGPVSLLDRAFEAKVRAALEDCPVLEGVVAVQRHWPREYSIEVVYRRPAVVVMNEGARIPFTWDGVRLPEEHYERSSAGLYELRGVPDPIPEPGETIESEAFLDGVETLRQIGPYLRELRPLGIEHIDVAEAGRPNGCVVLHTAAGVPVLWGRPRIDVGENPVAVKIEYLRASQDRLPSLVGWLIDVRFGKPYKRLPATRP